MQRMIFNRRMVAYTVCLWIAASLLSDRGSSEAQEPVASAAGPVLQSRPMIEAPIDHPSRAFLLVDSATGNVLASKNPHEPLIPASLTKVMTLRLVFKALHEGRIHLTDTVPVSVRAWGYRRPLRGTSLMFLEPGRPVTVDQLIEGMAVSSANDASVALAEYLGGSIAGFADMMNAEAARLGLTTAVFHDPHGLSHDNRISAADMARLAMSLLRDYPEYTDYAARPTINYNDILQYNNMRRFFRSMEGGDGLKTGFLSISGYSVVATAVRNEQRLVAVVLNTPRRVNGRRGDYSRDELAADLLQRGFTYTQTASR